MTSRDFCFWLQGYFEIQEDSVSISITPKQADIIKKHLALVFKHEIDPSMGDEKHQNELNEIHNKIKPPYKGWTDYPSDEPTKEIMRC